MVQRDGSRHRWLGPDQPLMALMAAIDDADNRLVGALFVPAESAWAT